MRLLYIIFLAALLSVLGIVHVAQARPVSYPGGWTAMLMNDGTKHSSHIHYSPTVNTSVGYKFEYWRDQRVALHAVQVNNLLKRWNNPDSQANLYLKSGIGMARSQADDVDHQTRAAGFTGVAADWENRRFFVSYQNRYTELGGIDDFYQQSARIGVAPYIGDYGDLHTWLMLQVEHMPEHKDRATVTPIARLFKGAHLLEAGVSNHNNVLFNYIFRY